MLSLLLMLACKPATEPPPTAACIPSDETCDGVDNDCDGEVDEGVRTVFFRDADDDGHGDPGESTDACEAEAGWVASDADCDDANAAIGPDAVEA